MISMIVMMVCMMHDGVTPMILNGDGGDGDDVADGDLAAATDPFLYDDIIW